MRGSAFSTGFIFDYWDWKKTYPKYQGDPRGRPKWAEEAIVVKPVHDSLKDEITQSGYVSLREWTSTVVFKAEKYLNTKTARKMKARRAFNGGTCTFTIPEDAPITKQHLMALILYCDFTQLCTAFSATFRLENPFEDLESLDKRHSKFVHFAKLLVEAVRDFGIDCHDPNNGKKDLYEPARGPFFCGINCRLNLGSYAIKFNGPCSTTTELSVALNFAKTEGMILQIDKGGGEGGGGAHISQCLFDCSWISNYFEEAEMLWISAEKPQRIVSIMMVETATNYGKMMDIFYSFDALLSGDRLYQIARSRNEVEFLSNLIAMTLKGGNALDGIRAFDSYLKNEWNLYLETKEQIVLHLFPFAYDLKGDAVLLRDLVMFNVAANAKGDIYWDPKEMENVFRGQWLSIFSSLKTLIINTFGGRFKFRMEPFMESMRLVPAQATVIILDQHLNGSQWPSQKWTQNAFSEKVIAEFHEMGWNVEYDPDRKGNVNYCTGGMVLQHISSLH